MKRFHIVLIFLIILTVPGGTNAVAAGVPCSVSDIEAFLLDTESACGNNFNETAPLTQLDAFTFSGVYAYTAIAHDADNSLFTSESINGFSTFSNQASSIANEWGSLKYVDFDEYSVNLYFNDSTDGPHNIPLNPHSFDGGVEDYLKVFRLTTASNSLSYPNSSYPVNSITLPPGTIIVGFNDNAGGGDADYDDIVIAMFPDADEDGVADGVDNCVDIYNPDQVDEDQDGLGDYCDDCPGDPFNDIDKDGVCGDVDNCPDDANSNQDDGDDDGIGYLCDNCKNAPNGFNLGTCVYKNFTDQGVVLTTGDTCSSVNSCPADEDYEEVYCSLNQEDIDNDGDGDACDITELVGSQIGAITLCELTVDGDPNTAADAFAALDWKRGFFFVTLKNQDGEELRVNNSVPRDLRVKKESDENGIVHYVYDNDSDVVEIDPPLNLKIPIDLTDGRFDPEEVAAAESLTATCHLIADIPDPDCTGQGIAEFCPSTPLQPLVVSSPPFPVLPIREVDINVKPWGPFNIIFLKSNDANRDTYCGPLFLHRLRVAILGSQDLKVKKIPIPSIRFQDAQVATYDENGKPVKFILDINHDGYDDLVVAFDKKDLNLTAEDKLAKLSGEAHYKNKKFAFTGSDFVKVIQCKRN